MKRTLVVGLVLLVSLIAFGGVAQAAPYRIGEIYSGQPFGDANVLGYMDNFLTCPGGGCFQGPALIDGHEYTWFVNPLPGTTTVTDSSKANYDSNNPGVNDTLTGWEYVLAKYDGPNAGVIVWYLGGETFTVPRYEPRYDDNGLALSGYWAFNSVTVPDGGSVAMLLGGALIGLAGLRRLLK